MSDSDCSNCQRVTPCEYRDQGYNCYRKAAKAVRDALSPEALELITKLIPMLDAAYETSYEGCLNLASEHLKSIKDSAGIKPEIVKTSLADVDVGDYVKIEVFTDNVAHKAGQYLATVEKADEKNFAVRMVEGGLSLWWFYKDTGRSYCGDAKASVIW